MDFQSAQGPGSSQSQLPIQPSPTQPPAPVQPPTTGGQIPTPAPPQKPPRKITIFALLLLIIIFALGGYLFIKGKLAKPPANVAAKVGAEKITKEDVAKFSKECNLDQKKAIEYLVDEKVLTKWANDEKLSVPQGTPQTQEGTAAGITVSSCFLTTLKVNALRDRLLLETRPYREGKFIIVNFGHYNPNSFAIKSPEATQEAKREALLKEERAYADSLAQSIYNDLKANKLTFEQAIKKVNNDPKVGLKSWYASSDQSGPFTALQYTAKRDLLHDDHIRQKVAALSIGQFSEPFIQQVNLTICDQPGNPACTPKYADTRWIIAKVERIGQATRESSGNLLEATRAKYSTMIYLK